MITNIIFKIIYFFLKPSNPRSRWLLEKIISNLHFSGDTNFKKSYLAYQPDSQVQFKSHPEFSYLLARFIHCNILNNAGDITRLWSLVLNIKQVISENISGDFAELGVYRGNTASVLAHFASKNSRKTYLFDTFEGFDNRDLQGVDADVQLAFSDTSIAMVKDVISEYSNCCEFIKGYFPSSLLPEHSQRKYAIVSLDCDLYEPMKAGFDFFYPLMPKGGLFLIHDYSSGHWKGAKKATDEFCVRTNEYPILLPDKSGSAFIRKSR